MIAPFIKMHKIIVAILAFVLLAACETDFEPTVSAEDPSTINNSKKGSTSAARVGSDGTGGYYPNTPNITEQHVGITFTNATYPDGVRIFNTRDVTFVNCTFSNPIEYAVLFREEQDSDDTNNVRFINCRFGTSRFDNVMIERRKDANPDEVLHTNVQFEGCEFSSWASDDAAEGIYRRYYHAIYAKCPDVVVNNCSFVSSVAGAGHAVSLRSSARVTNNIFRWTADGEPAISYTPKPLQNSPSLGNNTIKIWNNLMYGNHQVKPVGLILLETQTQQPIPDNLVGSISIAFNTMVYLPGGASDASLAHLIQAEPSVTQAYIAVYGNLLVDARPNRDPRSRILETYSRFDYVGKNYITRDLDGTFRDWREGDFHLKSTSPGVGAIVGETNYIVPTDKNGQSRSQTNPWPGCFAN